MELQRRIDDLLSKVDIAVTGNLTVQIGHAQTDQVGIVGQRLDEFLNQLRSSILSIRTTAEGLGGYSNKLTKNNTILQHTGQSTAVQAKSVATSTMQVSESIEVAERSTEQLSVSINEIASHSKEAATIAGEAGKVSQLLPMR